ncbi:hypothetical protein SAMN04487983_102179 [Streptomyces sp. yr375]|uniref:hypothetical protein n=1 Tax=Streptomyces sp. yr375 TaxID=1761906 RepID=UPI0008CC60C0|nr:hypothetical protein [Streptomyces sp. yr375]SER74614.1 hypothetical protein SAMN04487983_102179 [Streptomyces sp. yr375]
MSFLKCITNPLKCAVEVPAKAVVSTAVQIFAEAIGNATAEVLKSLNGVWLRVGSAAGSSGAIDDINAETEWLVAYIAVASLLVAAFKMAMDRRGEPLRPVIRGMMRVLLISTAGTWIFQRLATASDNFASYIYERSELGDRASTILGVVTLRVPGLILVLGLVVMLAAIVQIVLMYVRIGVLILLLGTLPLAASASMTGWGENWWRKHLGWLIAWLLYKPAAALVIYSATAMTRDSAGLDANIAGLGMLVLAVFALPALLQLVVPATAALGSASGGGMVLGAASDLTDLGKQGMKAMATGAAPAPSAPSAASEGSVSAKGPSGSEAPPDDPAPAASPPAASPPAGNPAAAQAMGTAGRIAADFATQVVHSVDDQG